jgi:SAM-dependent methyltransferase
VKKPLFLSNSFMPEYGKSAMKNVGDVASSRNNFFIQKPVNLTYLLNKRYSWMNNYIQPHHKGIELGSGAGFSKEFIKNKNFEITDFANFEWLDKKMVDAMNLSYEDESLDYIIESNMIHHLSKPSLFFKETNRVLKKGGVLLIQDVWGSLLLRLLCKTMKTEGYSYNVDVFNPDEECCDPENLWAGNNVIPNLLFDDLQKFENAFPFTIERFKHSEFMIFPVSGGVTSKVYMPDFPGWLLKFIDWVDDIFITIGKDVFSLQVQIVLRRK